MATEPEETAADWNPLEPSEMKCFHLPNLLGAVKTAAGRKTLRRCIQLVGEGRVLMEVSGGLDRELAVAQALPESPEFAGREWPLGPEELRQGIDQARLLHEQLVELVLIEKGMRRTPGTGEWDRAIEDRVLMASLIRWIRTMEIVGQDHSALGLLEGDVRGGVMIGFETGNPLMLSSFTHALWELCRRLLNALSGDASVLEWKQEERLPVQPRRPQQDRDPPNRAGDLAWDDRAILVALSAGAIGAKGIAPDASKRAHRPVRAQLVRQRKPDLVKWNLLEDTLRQYRLTDKGRQWAEQLSMAEAEARTVPKGPRGARATT
ncbi:MAG: hypothetical protein SGJ19_29240 [Planctomycetia bacterium]|nr:hypothetical protein [Planctomycetia bacterium]